MLLDGAKARCRRSGLSFKLTTTDFDIPDKCPVLGIPLRHNWGGTTAHAASPTLDRIVPSRGYVRGNVVVVSYRANRLRSDATVAELQKLYNFYGRLTRE